MRTAPLMALSAALVLSACSKVDDVPDGGVATEDAADPAIAVEGSAAVAWGSSTPTSPDVSPNDDHLQDLASGEIPKQFRGRWGLVAKDCTATPGEAKGLLTVSAKQLTFYESVATLGKVMAADSDRMRGAFRYSGEGQTWAQDVVLQLQDDGKSMVRRDYGPDALPGPQKYTRCN